MTRTGRTFRFALITALDWAWICAAVFCLSFRFQWIASFCFVAAFLLNVFLVHEYMTPENDVQQFALKLTDADKAELDAMFKKAMEPTTDEAMRKKNQ